MRLFQPEGTSRSISRALKSVCTDRGWKFEQRTAFRRSVPDHRNRDVRAHLLDPQQATELYNGMHLRNTGVIEVDRVFVPATACPRNRLRDYLPLRQFVRYKALHKRIGRGASGDLWAEQTADDFQDWIDRSDKCEGENDPRCLPFHVFSTIPEDYDLDAPEDRRRFNKGHGSQGSRSDSEGLQWDRPNAREMHGRQALHVAGRSLVRGFHWDVSIGSRASGPTEVSSTKEIWRIWGEGYVNVYPDAGFRSGKGSARIYP